MEKDNLKTKNIRKEIVKIFKKHGLSNDHAVISANAVINAELVGAYGHGLTRLKMYCDRISKKVINPKPKIKIKIKRKILKLPRVGDHIWYISDTSKFKKHYPKWKQKFNTRKIIEELIEYQK